jgi:hypothetical protein
LAWRTVSKKRSGRLCEASLAAGLRFVSRKRGPEKEIDRRAVNLLQTLLDMTTNLTPLAPGAMLNFYGFNKATVPLSFAL